jgi:acyl-CoA thioesterase I
VLQLIVAAAMAGRVWAAGGPPAKNVVLFLGDSLTAGYGVAPEEAYPSLLDALWRKKGRDLFVRNGGVSGATTADVAASLGWTLTDSVRLVFLAIGANDGLRGLPVEKASRNISSIIETCRKKRIDVVLAGMKIPPNYGPAYTRSFEAIYPRLARKYGLKLVPFLLEGVAGDPKLNIEDGLHPNAAGHRIIADHLEKFFEEQKALP